MRLHLVTLIAGVFVGGCGVDFATNPSEELTNNSKYDWPVGWGELSEGGPGSGADLTRLSMASATVKATLSKKPKWLGPPNQQQSSAPTPQKTNTAPNTAPTTPTTGPNYAPSENTDYSPSRPLTGDDVAPPSSLFNVGAVPSVGDFRTYTQGAWGTLASGNNPGSYRDSQFNLAFASSLKIGCLAGQHLALTSSVAVAAFLPQGGQPGALSSSWIDPTGGTLAGELAGQVVSLALNVGFDSADPDFCTSDLPLEDLILVGTPCAGMTVGQVLELANKVLGGCNPTNPKLINACVATINEAFDGGETSSTQLRLPL